MDLYVSPKIVNWHITLNCFIALNIGCLQYGFFYVRLNNTTDAWWENKSIMSKLDLISYSDLVFRKRMQDGVRTQN